MQKYKKKRSDSIFWNAFSFRYPSTERFVTYGLLRTFLNFSFYHGDAHSFKAIFPLVLPPLCSCALQHRLHSLANRNFLKKFYFGVLCPSPGASFQAVVLSSIRNFSAFSFCSKNGRTYPAILDNGRTASSNGIPSTCCMYCLRRCIRRQTEGYSSASSLRRASSAKAIPSSALHPPYPSIANIISICSIIPLSSSISEPGYTGEDIHSSLAVKCPGFSFQPHDAFGAALSMAS